MPKITMPQIPDLAEALASAMPELDANDRALALAVYRGLATGGPVTERALAHGLGRPDAEIADTLRRWPGAYRDDAGRIIGFWGLAIPEMPHSFRVEGCQLYTWCAWDALFLPELIGKAAEVESRSPTSGEAIRLTVTPTEVAELWPAESVVSMLSPTQEFDHQVLSSFCHFVHFFPSADDARPWLGENENVFLLSVREAHELGRDVNRRRFGYRDA